MAKTVTIRGDRELAAIFKAMQGDIQGDVLMTAATAGLLPINNAAQRLAAYQTGTLRRSIHIEPIKQSATYAEAASGTDVEYGPRIEFGFNDTDSLGRSYHQAAQPYMRPAYDAYTGEAISETEKALRTIVTKHAK